MSSVLDRVPAPRSTLRRHRRASDALSDARSHSADAGGAWRRAGVAVAAIAVAVMTVTGAWLSLGAHPLSPDEAGFWFLAQQWHPGRSLYGEYWVDRPPLLLWLFDLAGSLAPAAHPATGLSAPGVGLLGAAAAGLSVALTGTLVRLLTTSLRVLLVVLTAVAGLLVDPMLGMPDTNGEVLALPFVMTGVVALVAVARKQSAPGTGARDGAATKLLCVVAGAAAVCAVGVKQNMVDVVVMATVVLLAVPATRTVRWQRVALFAAGGVAAGVVALAAAAQRGTTPGGLWDAVVVFRLHASAVISSGASGATTDRARSLGLAALASGLVPLLLLSVGALGPRLGAGLRRSPAWVRRLRWAGVAMAGWEAIAVAAGGSYWTHYLTGLIPGTVLLLTLALDRAGPRTTRVLALAAVAVAVTGGSLWAQQVVTTPAISQSARVENYLRTHAHVGDQVTAAFGDAPIVAGSGLSSPYKYLWSLPVRVRDPHLVDLTRILAGPSAPRFMVVSGRGLGTWGVKATGAQKVFDRRYVPRATYGRLHIFELRRRGTTLP